MILTIQDHGDEDCYPQRTMIDNVTQLSARGADKRSMHKYYDPDHLQVHYALYDYAADVVKDHCNSLRCKTGDGKEHLVLFDRDVFISNENGKTIDKIKYIPLRD